MDYELRVSVSNNEYRILMQDGFFEFESHVYVLHKHRYDEIHIIENGEYVFSIDGKQYCVGSDTAIIIPKEKYHRCESALPGTRHCAFQIALDCDEIKTVQLPKGYAHCLFEKISDFTANRSICISDYISPVISELSNKCKDELLPISNREFIIFEFFANNYNNDATVSDLAKKLCVCEKQAQRLVKKYTGNSFRTQKALLRRESAKKFIEEGKFDLCDISSKVGYKSYSGFWKSFKKE